MGTEPLRPPLEAAVCIGGFAASTGGFSFPMERVCQTRIC